MFQHGISKVLEGISVFLYLMNDTLLLGATQDVPDQCLKQVMEKLKLTVVALNVDKCEFSEDTLKSLCQVVDKNGSRPDPEITRVT